MSVVGLIIENQTVALSLLKFSRLRLVIEATPVDGPGVESPFPAVDLAESERDCLIRSLRGTVPSKERIVPTLGTRLHPTRSISCAFRPSAGYKGVERGRFPY